MAFSLSSSNFRSLQVPCFIPEQHKALYLFGGGNIVITLISGPLRGSDRPRLTQILWVMSVHVRCAIRQTYPFWKTSNQSLVHCSHGICSEQDPPLPLGCPWCSRWLLWCWVLSGVPRTLFSKNRHFVLVPLLYRHEIPVVLGSRYTYTLLFHRCMCHTAVGWQSSSCQNRCLSGYLTYLVVSYLHVTTTGWSRSMG